MDDAWGQDTQKRKCDAVSDAINRLLSTLVLRCAKGEEVRDYFQVGVIGYGGAVRGGFAGSLANRQFATISEVADNPIRVEQRSRKEDDGAGRLGGTGGSLSGLARTDRERQHTDDSRNGRGASGFEGMVRTLSAVVPAGRYQYIGW